MKKSRTITYHLVVRNIALLILLLGTGSVIFFFAASKIYVQRICNSIEQYYDRLEQADIEEEISKGKKEQIREDKSDNEEENPALLGIMEDEGMIVDIYDQDGRILYSTMRKDSVAASLKHPENYAKSPATEMLVTNNRRRFRIRGELEQNGQIYYVRMNTTITGVRASFSYASKLFLALMVVYAGIVALMFQKSSSKITRALANIQLISEQIVNRDYAKKLEEKQEFVELSQLAISINRMSDHIQENIQELEKYNALLEEDKDRQAQIEQMRQQFFSNVSHEMKTPLFIISSRIEMMECIDDPEKKEEYRKSIFDEIFQMNELLESMLHAYSEDYSGDQEVIEENDVSKVARDALVRYEQLFARRKIKLVTEFEKECMLWCDAQNLKIAMNNYLMNAFRNTSNEGMIRVRVKRREDMIRFEVYNDGMQISEEQQEEIWKKFYKGTESAGRGGTGLGLYLVKTYMDRKHGNYGVSNIENGVEFWFELPQMREERISE